MILTPEMSATLWMGTSFLLCSPFPFLMALESRGSAGNQLLPQLELPPGPPATERGLGWGMPGMEGTEPMENPRMLELLPDPWILVLAQGCRAGTFPGDAPSGQGP